MQKNHPDSHIEDHTATSTPHKRRVRYSGTHPKTYQEKYKEHQPDKYSETIEKVIQKGSTPAGMHISIMVREILDFLQIQPGQTGLDATLGYGGHTARMLACLEHQGHMYALDIDPIEIEKTKQRLADQGYGPDILTICRMNFADMDQLLEQTDGFDFILADLGVSSMQIDNPERGFTFKHEGPLDLRLDPTKGESAASRLRSMTREEIEGMLIENSDEPYALEISRAITSCYRKGGTIETTIDLKNVIEKALTPVLAKNPPTKPLTPKELIKKSCTRTFQALRIDVNSEFEVLEAFLDKLPRVLKSGGRAAILTFHSGEDRLVKKSFKALTQEGIYSDYSREVTRPTPEECRTNPRAHSTKLRWAIKS